jgi:hypothetical protein
MANKQRNTNYDILDKILSDSQQGRNEVVWVQDPRHPEGGYYVQASDLPPGAGPDFKTVDDIERYLRS